MPKLGSEDTIFTFLTYPQIGEDDWRYTAQTAVVRALEMQLLSHGVLADMAGAPDFNAAIGSLAAGEYAIPQSVRFDEVQTILLDKRAAVRELFEDLMLDEEIVTYFKARDDFANLRLAARRAVTDTPIGTDYSAEGNVAPELFATVFEEENYGLFPGYLRDAAEQAVLAYYQDKKIPEIDYAIDRCEAEYKVGRAREIGQVFLLNLARMQIDLANIRTVLRLKHSEAEHRNVLLDGGFVEMDRHRQAIEQGDESLGQLFFATPYHRLVDSGVGYFASNQSFLKIEQQCDEYVMGYLRQAAQITAGPQPIIAWLLMKEHEIRMVRLVLTAKKNLLDTKLILDRLS